MTRVFETIFALGMILSLIGLMAAPSVVATTSQESPDDAVDLPEHTPPTVPADPVARIEGDSDVFASAQAAIDAARPGDTVVLEGQFTEQISITTSNITVTASDQGASIDGENVGDVVTIGADNVTVNGLWVRNSGSEVESEDAGVFINGDDVTVTNLYVTNITFGMWVDGVDRVELRNNRIEGRSNVFPLTDRGNGIQLWDTVNTTVCDNEITAVRDGIYYSWAENVDSVNNTIWNSRFAVHYMYSDNNRLSDNLAVNNDVGYALMISTNLEVTNNTAIRNYGTSGHGILLKDIERSDISHNTVVANTNGLYVYNAQHNSIEDNLILHNTIGLYSTADSQNQAIVGNSFIQNGQQALTATTRQKTWNSSTRGNYWSDARTVDITGNGMSDIRHQPAGIVEHLTVNQPQAKVFAESPAFEAIRLTESSFPVIESPGIIDYRPLMRPQHDWEHYADIPGPQNPAPSIGSDDPTSGHMHHDPAEHNESMDGSDMNNHQSEFHPNQQSADSTLSDAVRNSLPPLPVPQKEVLQ